MKYTFKAKTKNGEIKEGIIEATSGDAALDILQKNGLIPTSITAEKDSGSLTKTVLKYYDRVTHKELVVFFRQLAILIEARVPIVSSLTAIGEQTSNKYFVKVIREIINDIDDGMPFSDAMTHHRDVFSNLCINLIKAEKLRET